MVVVVSRARLPFFVWHHHRETAPGAEFRPVSPSRLYNPAQWLVHSNKSAPIAAGRQLVPALSWPRECVSLTIEGDQPVVEFGVRGVSDRTRALRKGLFD